MTRARRGSAMVTSLDRVACSASMTVFPVTTIVDGSMPSDSRFLREVAVGARCSAARGAVRRRFTFSGNGA